MRVGADIVFEIFRSSGGPCHRENGHVPQSQTERHAERLAWLNTSWSSIDLRMTHALREMMPREGKPQTYDKIAIEYVETASGWRLLKERYLNSATGGEVSLSVHTFDGVRGADSFERRNGKRPQQIVFHRHFGNEDKSVETNRPMPLFYQWVGRQRIHEAIRGAKYLGEFKVGGKPCDAFLFARTGPSGEQDRVHYLDRKSSVPLQVIAYANPRAREKGLPLTVWKASEIRQVQGYPFVWSASQEDYTGEPGVISYRREYLVESVVFNKAQARSDFRPEIHENAFVIDTVANTVLKSPGYLDRPSAVPEHAAISSVPIRAEPSRPWADLAGSVSATAGAALLIASFLLWRRRP